MLKYLLLGLLTALALFGQTQIVVLGDPHIPGKNLPMKERVLEHINAWNDVDMVVAMGDVCSQTGTEKEYAHVKDYFSKLTKPLYVITGNHDFIYDDELDSNGKLQHATPQIQEEKLKRFQSIFHLPTLYASIQKENYRLIFLFADDSKHLARISQKQLKWFEHELQKYPLMPTIVFFHAPLENTLETYNHWVNTPHFIAQPKEKLHHLIEKNPQLFLWVSGHTHTSPKEPSFASNINRFKNVTNIHNADMNKEPLWTNSLFLSNDKVVVKTYNHTEKRWQNELERTFFIPKF